MTGLPGGLAEPLRYAEPFSARTLLLLALLGALAALWALYRWRARRQGPIPAAPTPIPALPPAAPSRLEAAIRELRHRHRRQRDLRPACHELSRLLRHHFEETTRLPFSRLTAREIRRFGDTPRARLLALLAQLQFGRRPPSRSDFDGICELALETDRGSPG